MNTQGILYIATGEKYIHAAIRSAKTVNTYCPNLRIHLYADWQNYDFKFEQSPFPFSSIGKIENPHRRSKVDYMASTPFDKTLYLDTDTTLNADISDMFRVLERFDIALAHAHKRNTEVNIAPWRIEIPQAFPQYNSGVILYRSNPIVIQFLKDWSSFYQEADLRHDQPTLRELLWLSDLRIATLPPEYNVRFMKYHFLWSKSEAETKIFHLKQLHKGWLPWLNKRSHTTRMVRKFGLGWLVDFIKKKLR